MVPLRFTPELRRELLTVGISMGFSFQVLSAWRRYNYISVTTHPPFFRSTS